MFSALAASEAVNPEKAGAQQQGFNLDRIIGVVGEIYRERERAAQEQARQDAETRRRQLEVEQRAAESRGREDTERQRIAAQREVELERAKGQLQIEVLRLEIRKLELQRDLASTQNDRDKARIQAELRMVEEGMRTTQDKQIQITAEGKTTTVDVKSQGGKR